MAVSAVLAGIGGWLPPSTVTNADLAERIGVGDDWVFGRTGIRQRHVVDAGTSTVDLAVEAGARALTSAHRDSVDAVLLATATPDHPMPASAPAVAARLGQGRIAAYDVHAVCAGFLYGLANATALIMAGMADWVLVVGADVFSGILPADDRSITPLFGDGAGAVVLRRGDQAELGALHIFDLGSDGDQADLIMVPGGGSRQRSGGRPADCSDMYFRMDGHRTFTAAVTHMARSSRAVLARLGRTPDDVDWVVGHQANSRVLRAVAGQLGVPVERMFMNIERVGNTSAASIPLALCDAVVCGRLQPGQFIVLTAFGGGLAWGSTAMTWPRVNPA